MKIFMNFLHLSTADRWLAVEALAWLGVARAAVLALPFRFLAARLGERDVPPETIEQLPLDPRSQRVGWVIERVSHHTPWRSNCLAQAIAGQRMLHRRRIASMLYIGVTKNSRGQLEAHAWLSSGGIVLTGGCESDYYTVMVKFRRDGASAKK